MIFMGRYKQRGVKIPIEKVDGQGHYVKRHFVTDRGLNLYYCKNCRRGYSVDEMSQNLLSNHIVDDGKGGRVQLGCYCLECYRKLKMQGKIDGSKWLSPFVSNIEQMTL